MTRLCSAVLESGVHCGTFPHCIDEEACQRNQRCHWRQFHQLADDQYRKKQAQAQQDLFKLPIGAPAHEKHE